MAWISRGWFLTVSVVDTGNDRTIKTYALTATVEATIDTDVATILTKLATVTDGALAGYNVSERFYEDSLNLPAGNVQNENKASISVILNNAKTGNLKIPAASSFMFQGATGAAHNVVDVEDTILVAYTDIFKTGAEASMSDGDFLASLSSGKRINAKNNNG